VLLPVDVRFELLGEIISQNILPVLKTLCREMHPSLYAIANQVELL
jgi:hypothetical protein